MIISVGVLMSLSKAPHLSIAVSQSTKATDKSRDNNVFIISNDVGTSF